MKRQATSGGRKNRRRPGNLREQVDPDMQRAYDEARLENNPGMKPRDLWPTPTTQENEHPHAVLTENGRRLSRDGKASHGLNLADSVKMWPTPTSSDVMGLCPKGIELRNGRWVRISQTTGTEFGAKLSDAVNHHKQSLSTEVFLGECPELAGGQSTRQTSRNSLPREKQEYGTPTARMSERSRKFQETGLPTPAEVARKESGKSGQLNPDWVEWLMNWPVGWTSLSPLTEDRFLGWQRGSRSALTA